MVQSEAPLYALQEVVDPLQNGHLLVDPRLGIEVEVLNMGQKLPLVNSKNGLTISVVLQSRLSRKTHMLLTPDIVASGIGGVWT